MTTNIDHLALIKATIDTQYDLARIEIFRPLEIFDRYQGIKARDMGHECRPKFESLEAYAKDDPGALEIAELVKKVSISSGAAPWTVSLFENRAHCTCSPRQREPIYRYSVKVSITWNGRTLTREYLLPEVAK